MKNKKKIIFSVVSVVLVLGIIAGALALYFTKYHKDENDTEELMQRLRIKNIAQPQSRAGCSD